MKLPIMTILLSALLTGCAYQEGVLADRDAEKAQAPTHSSTTVDTTTSAAPAPASAPTSKAASTASRVISPLTN